VWEDNNRRALKVTLGIAAGRGHSVTFFVRRRTVPRGVGTIERTLDQRERTICETVVDKLGPLFSQPSPPPADTMAAMFGAFDELVVAAYIHTRTDRL
jgi:hypothetical protein